MEQKITLCEFAEQIAPCPLTEWQKDMLRVIEKADAEKMEILYCTGRCLGRKVLSDILREWEVYMSEQREQLAIEKMIEEAGRVADTAATKAEIMIAKAVAKEVCAGYVNHVEITNATREQRKRITAIAYNMVGNKPLLCKIIGTKKGKCCESCSRVCCHNKVLQRRFAAEMFPGFRIY